MDEKWITYHATRLNLIQSIDSHLNSIDGVNVYNNGSRADIPLNTSGDYSLTNKSMGHDLITTLRKKISLDSDEEIKTISEQSQDELEPITLTPTNNERKK
tara:strand:+ start:3617 stop:3919 length:303 start_codon:yes stop_codon:yes gene_type:complete